MTPAEVIAIIRIAMEVYSGVRESLPDRAAMLEEVKAEVEREEERMKNNLQEGKDDDRMDTRKLAGSNRNSGVCDSDSGGDCKDNAQRD